MKNIKIWIGVCLLIFLIGAAGSVIVLMQPHSEVVSIKQDGQVLYTIDLAASPDKTIDIEYKGSINTVEIKDHRIRILSADCPDQTCVHTGFLRSSAEPIVCLPHKLIIEYKKQETAVDAEVR